MNRRRRLIRDIGNELAWFVPLAVGLVAFTAMRVALQF